MGNKKPIATPMLEAPKTSKIIHPKYAMQNDTIVINITIRSFSFFISITLSYASVHLFNPDINMIIQFFYLKIYALVALSFSPNRSDAIFQNTFHHAPKQFFISITTNVINIFTIIKYILYCLSFSGYHYFISINYFYRIIRTLRIYIYR